MANFDKIIFKTVFKNTIWFKKISLFQKTVLRTKNEIFNKPIVICAADHKFTVREQISSIYAVFSFSNNNFLSLSKRNVYYIKKKLKC